MWDKSFGISQDSEGLWSAIRQKAGVDGWNVLGPDIPLVLDSRHVQDWTSVVSSEYHNYTSSIGNEPSTFRVEYANQIDKIQVTQTLMTPTGLLHDIDPKTWPMLHSVSLTSVVPCAPFLP